MGQYQHMTYRGITMVRGILVTMLYNKASSLRSNETNPTNSLTLMSADVERITQGWQTMHEIWANSAEIALAIYLLDRQLGISCVVPVCVALGESNRCPRFRALSLTIVYSRLGWLFNWNVLRGVTASQVARSN